jgi:hypothetical protein
MSAAAGYKVAANASHCTRTVSMSRRMKSANRMFTLEEAKKSPVWGITEFR